MLSLRESNSAQLASAWRHECCDSGSNPGSHIFFVAPFILHGNFAWACMPLFHQRGASFFHVDGSWSRLGACIFAWRAFQVVWFSYFICALGWLMVRARFEWEDRCLSCLYSTPLAYLCGNLLSLFSNAIYSLALPSLLCLVLLRRHGLAVLLAHLLLRHNGWLLLWLWSQRSCRRRRGRQPAVGSQRRQR